MNPMGYCTKSLFLLLASLAIAQLAMAGDHDILTDFIVPPGAPDTIDGNFFTFTGARPFTNVTYFPAVLKTLDINAEEFPALYGQSVSYSIQLYPVGSINLHMHPRSAELLFVVNGKLEVGFVDSTNKLFTQTLEEGEMFVFPKGLVHFEYNSGPEYGSRAISAFGSADPGSVSLPNTLFNAGISDDDLAKSFNTDLRTILKLKAGLHS